MSDLDCLLHLVRERRSIRRFRSDSVDPRHVQTLLEAARWAPSAANRQAYRFIVVTSRATVDKMAASVAEAGRALLSRVRPDLAANVESYLHNFGHFAQAPVVLVPIYRAGPELLGASLAGGGSDAEGRARLDALCSVAAAITQLLLAAHAQGLGACWMTGPLIAEPALAADLRLPDGWRIAALIPLGYADEHPPAPPRRRVDQLVWPAPTVQDDPHGP